MAVKETLVTPLCERLGIKVPIMLAGMGNVAHAKLVAAVSNAGGIGIIGGFGMTPKFLKKEIAEVKSYLTSPDLPFGVDLLLPQVGGNARKTNSDYTEGKLGELIDIIIEEKAKCFVSAVGVPPKWVVEKLHGAGIFVMNMVGAPKHVDKALDAGADMVIAQGSEGGGHTGDISSFPLFPQCVERCKGKMAPLDGKPVLVVAAGGIADGRGLAASLSLGCVGVWVGTRFVAAEESAASPRHKQLLCEADANSTIRTVIFTGRPMRVLMSDFVRSWEVDRKGEAEKLVDKGVIAWEYSMKQAEKKGEPFSFAESFPLLMGQCAGSIKEVKPAAEIMEEMIQEAIQTMKEQTQFIAKL